LQADRVSRAAAASRQAIFMMLPLQELSQREQQAVPGAGADAASGTGPAQAPRMRLEFIARAQALLFAISPSGANTGRDAGACAGGHGCRKKSVE
ncbi:MAG: hypothetical protein EBS11_22875, partial [Janthinobacterium sp.]|nr:hypothetical protein [Janthinobacterium sp.]